MSPRAASKKSAATADTSRAPSPEDAVQLLRAMLMLMLERREADDESDRPTLQLLEEAGLDHRQIAELTGKSSDAVRMALSRAKKTPAQKTPAKKAVGKKTPTKTTASKSGS